MAQRFSDWYYSIISVRLGDARGRVPLQRACLRFQQGIASVTNPAELIEWAYLLIAEEVHTAGDWLEGGDFPNQLTGGRTPTELLRAVASKLKPADVRLLSAAFDKNISQEHLSTQAEAAGGMPLAILNARYALKSALKEHAGVRFQEVPDQPNLDYMPLPLYEAGRMGTAREQAGFEKWMLSNIRICRDVAEFGVFSLALRNGALKNLVPEPVESHQEPSEPSISEPEPPEPRISEPPQPNPPPHQPPLLKGMAITVIGGLIGIMVALITLLILYHWFTG
jgi:hypothetical protein